MNCIKYAFLKIIDCCLALARNSVIRKICWPIVSIAGLATILYLSLSLTSLSISSIEQSYQHFDNSLVDLFRRNDGSLDQGTLPYIFTTVLGVVFGIAVTIMAVVLTVRSTQAENRKQSTIKIILESRVSETFKNDLATIHTHFPDGRKASITKFKRYSKSNKLDEKKVANALIQMLNYYEFIAIGIRKGDIDGKMMKETIRGPLCRLIFEKRDIIRYYRVDMGQKKTFENIVALYWLWVDEGQKWEYDNAWAGGVQCLGPPPPPSVRFLSNCRSTMQRWRGEISS